jgi:hypothetical protein
MLTANTLKYLAALTAVLFAAAALIGSDNDVLWILDDIVFVGFIICAILLIALSATVLVRHMTTSRHVEQGRAD